MPSTARLVRPATRTPLSRRNRFTCTTATARKTRQPATTTSIGAAPCPAIPYAAAPIWTATATPSEVWNHGGQPEPAGQPLPGDVGRGQLAGGVGGERVHTCHVGKYGSNFPTWQVQPE